MYNRALSQLKTILQNKGLKDSSVVINNGNFGLYHFHIDSSDNNISLNKFETKAEVPEPRHQIAISESHNSTFASKDAQHNNSLTFGNAIMLHKQVDDSIDFQQLHLDGRIPTILEEEDFVSEALVRDSPHIGAKRPSKNQQFMMHIRQTLPHETLS